jgi:beta-1,2-mannobiose phosphorylase / 1,2-beta-oligomannan phosphorylase
MGVTKKRVTRKVLKKVTPKKVVKKASLKKVVKVKKAIKPTTKAKQKSTKPKKVSLIKKVSLTKKVKRIVSKAGRPVAKGKKILKKALKRAPRPLDLKRALTNPLMGPTGTYWESEAVFNPGAVVNGDRVHLFYRALGYDGVSRVGYASSKDGINFDRRYSYPVYMPESIKESSKHHPFTSPARLAYNQALYVSGGGWGGCEDPRAVKIGDRVYMSFNIFNGWNSIRVGMTSIHESDLDRGRWNWRRFVFLSPRNQRHKNWVLFPDKINGKFALLHNLYDPDPTRVCVEFVDDIEKPLPAFSSHDPQRAPDRDIAWHHRTRSVGPPPVKTSHGWLVFYHAMDKNDPHKYKLGAMLLDLNDPRKVLYRSQYPILEPDEWYENDWKPGIVYATGAVIKDGKLLVYYGGGDKYVGMAEADLEDFLRKLKTAKHIELSKKKVKIKK